MTAEELGTLLSSFIVLVLVSLRFLYRTSSVTFSFFLKMSCACAHVRGINNISCLVGYNKKKHKGRGD